MREQLYHKIRSYSVAAGLTLGALGVAVLGEQNGLPQLKSVEATTQVSKIACDGVISEKDEINWPAGLFPFVNSSEWQSNLNQETNRIDIITGPIIWTRNTHQETLLSQYIYSPGVVHATEIFSGNKGDLDSLLLNQANYHGIFRTSSPGGYSFKEQTLFRAQMYENMLSGNPNGSLFILNNLDAEQAQVPLPVYTYPGSNYQKVLFYPGVNSTVADRNQLTQLAADIKALSVQLCTEQSQPEADPRKGFAFSAARPSSINYYPETEQSTRSGEPLSLTLKKGQIALIQTGDFPHIVVQHDGREQDTAVTHHLPVKDNPFWGDNSSDTALVQSIASVNGGETIKIKGGGYTSVVLAETTQTSNILQIANAADILAGVRGRQTLTVSGSCGLSDGCLAVTTQTYIISNYSLILYDQQGSVRPHTLNIPLIPRTSSFDNPLPIS